MNELGLYMPDGTFIPDRVIKRKALAEDRPNFVHDPKKPKDFGYWSDRMVQRQAQVQETLEPIKTHEVLFNHEPLVNFQADLHVGGTYTDYKRIEAEAQTIIDTPHSYVVLMGDLIDGFAFNPAEFDAMEQVQEQMDYAKALVKAYHGAGKLLGVWNGNHDNWVKKAGFSPYRYIMDGVDVPYYEGIGYMTLDVEGTKYKLTGNHMFKGNSMYNNTHPQRRAMNESARGSDLVVSGHWHTKGISQQAFQEFGGESQLTTMIALGTYKSTDEYVRIYGMSNQDSKQMYGASVFLHNGDKNITPYYDILQAHQSIEP